MKRKKSRRRIEVLNEDDEWHADMFYKNLDKEENITLD
jgi:hypothetical protein